MLNGIGGNTIEEAKQRLTYGEALRWFAYLKKHGTPNQHLHHGFAMLAAMINNALGGKADIQDYMLGGGQQPAPEEEATLEDVLMILQGKRT